MALTASFEVDVTKDDADAFARLSGDFNPLHTDAAYAAATTYKTPILHGAFSAGLVSRLAGMHLPGRECLLHGIRLRFSAPIVPPKKLSVSGKVIRGDDRGGTVEVTISDVQSGVLYVSGAYDFGLHSFRTTDVCQPVDVPTSTQGGPKILVTGASGGLGSAVMARLGDRAIGVTKGGAAGPGMISAPDISCLAERLGDTPIEAIVHCGWPAPDNQRLTSLSDVGSAVQYHLAEPMAYVVELAKLLAERGIPGAMLVAVGSTFANPGRHAFRMPLYSVAKASLATLTKVLALELGIKGKRCLCLNFDVIAGGMNASISSAVRLGHADRSPCGELATPEAAADQIVWALGNPSHLASGAIIEVSGGAIP